MGQVFEERVRFYRYPFWIFHLTCKSKAELRIARPASAEHSSVNTGASQTLIEVFDASAKMSSSKYLRTYNRPSRPPLNPARSCISTLAISLLASHSKPKVGHGQHQLVAGTNLALYLFFKSTSKLPYSPASQLS